MPAAPSGSCAQRPTSLCGKTLMARAAQAAAVDDTGVIELVRDHDVVFAQDRGNGAGVRGEAALKDDDGLRLLELGETAFELHVDLERPRDRPYRSRADTVATDGVQRLAREVSGAS